MSSFPHLRMRRNRMDDWSRRLVAETTLCVDNLIWPVFIQEGEKARTAISSMPFVSRLSVDELVKDVGVARDLGIPAIALFPVTPAENKTPDGDEALNPNNLVCRAITAIKETYSDIGVICDVALDPYTIHGHDGVIRNGAIDNDETMRILCKQATLQARAGCDVIAPSDMMDGRIGAVRRALDDGNFANVRILAYAAKYASAFYGPFRDAIGSSSNLGKSDKRTYQMDARQSDEALREVKLDIEEGADMVMVKPGMPYLDIIRRVKDAFRIPTFAYQVSGEYAMIHAAGANGWLDSEAAMKESLVSFRRAGADAIFTYAAMDIARAIRG
jgi:porphobilinogen synthase